MLINDGKTDFKEKQINKLIDFLKDLSQRYPYLNLKTNLVGLGEVAIEKDIPIPRCEAPGKFFPWERLAQYGFGLFLNTTLEQKKKLLVGPKTKNVFAIWGVKETLKCYGYDNPVGPAKDFGPVTQAWVTRFNERYVPDSDKVLGANVWSEASEQSFIYISKDLPSCTFQNAVSSLFTPFAASSSNDVAIKSWWKSLRTAQNDVNQNHSSNEINKISIEAQGDYPVEKNEINKTSVRREPRSVTEREGIYSFREKGNYFFKGQSPRELTSQESSKAEHSGLSTYKGAFYENVYFLRWMAYFSGFSMKDRTSPAENISDSDWAFKHLQAGIKKYGLK